jgi:phosphomannomutase
MIIQELIKNSGVSFGTSGVRGLENLLTDELCGAYTQAFLSIFDDVKYSKVALGMDLRPSSLRIATACANAVRKMGLEVDFCGELPTPALAYYAQEEKIPAIMVTGSHIPFDRNGIKFYRPEGEITKDDEQNIINSPLQVLPSDSINPLPKLNQNAIDIYLKRYTNFFPENSLYGLKIGLYEHSSVARDVLRVILEELGADVVSLGRTDNFVPIDTEAVSVEDIERGRDWAKEYGFDAIVSTDGDGDRPLISDETGTWLRGDIVGLLCAQYLNISQLAVPVSCNTAIESCGKFRSVSRTKIGSPFVIEKMQSLKENEGYIAGFEANGGFLLESLIKRQQSFIHRLPTRDATLPILTVLSLANENLKPVSWLLKSLPTRFTASDRLQNFPNELSASLTTSLTNNSDLIKKFLPQNISYEISNIDLTDGIRFTFKNNEIIHLRASGNAPELRCYAEAGTQSCADNLVRTCLLACVRGVMV